MLYILSGPDDYSIAQALDGLKKEAGTDSAFSAGAVTLDGQHVTIDELRDACLTVPFLSGKRLVIIKELLERFEPRSRPARQKKTTSSRQPDESKSFSACFENVPPSTTVVLVESRLTNNNPLLKELAGKAKVDSFPLLKVDKLKPWIQQRVKEAGSSISPQAVDSLTKLVGSNLWIMAGEIDKLVSFAAGRRIEEDDVRKLVSQGQQSDVFDMVDAILDFRGDTAARVSQELLQKGAAPTYLLFMLCRQVRLVVRAKELSRQGAPETEIQTRLGVTSSFVVRKTLEQASRYSMERLKTVYSQLLAADLWIKTGKYDGELAVDILVAELCRRQTRRAAALYELD